MKDSFSKVYVSTDISEIIDAAQSYGFFTIERPRHLCSVDAGLDQVISRCVGVVENLSPASIYGIFMGNVPFFVKEDIKKAKRILIENPDYDSVVSVGQFPMFAPERARKINQNGELTSYIENRSRLSASCDRSSHENCYFANGSFTIVRTDVLKKIKLNPPPFPWQGSRILPYIQPPGVGDVDTQWQLPITNWWVKKYL